MAAQEFVAGQPARAEQLQRFEPDQQKALQQLLQMGMQGLQNPYGGFDPIAQRARSQFNQQTIPTLAERFTSMGGYGTGALSSPVFASQLGAAGAGLEEGLAALQSQYGLQNRALSQGLLGYGLQPRTENIFMSGQPGFAQETLPAFLKLLLKVAASYLPGGVGSILS